MNPACIIANWKALAIGAVVMAFGLMFWDRAVLKADIADQKTEITRLSDANAEFAQAAQRNNDAMARAEQIRATMEREYQKAVAAAQASADDHARKEAAILADRVNGDPCVYAHTLISQYMKGRHP